MVKLIKRRDNKEIFSYSFRSIKSEEVLQHKLLFDAIPYKYRSFNAYLHRFALRENPSCTHCEPQTANAEHIIYDCPEYQEHRNQLIERLETERMSWPCIQSVFISSKTFEYLNNFCKSIFNIND